MTPDDLLKRLARSGPTSVATSGRPTNLSSSSWPWDALRTAGNGSFPMRTWSHTCANCCETSGRPGRLCIPCSRFDGCSPMNCGRFPGSRNSPRTRAETSGEPSTRSCGNIFPSPFTGRSARRPTFPETGRRGMLKSRQRNRRCANGRAARRPSIRPSRDAGVATHGSAIRCSVCDLDIRLGERLLGVEAAHIQWHSHDGPDEVANGLALCLLHHKALDRGALGLGETTGSLVDFSGQRIRRPRTRTLQPAPEYVDWHRKEVFRSRTA